MFTRILIELNPFDLIEGELVSDFNIKDWML